MALLAAHQSQLADRSGTKRIVAQADVTGREPSSGESAAIEENASAVIERLVRTDDMPSAVLAGGIELRRACLSVIELGRAQQKADQIVITHDDEGITEAKTMQGKGVPNTDTP